MQSVVRSVVNNSTGHFGTKTLLDRMTAAHLHKCVTPGSERIEIRKKSTFQLERVMNANESICDPVLSFLSFSNSAKDDARDDIEKLCAVIILCWPRKGSPLIRSSIGNCFRENHDIF